MRACGPLRPGMHQGPGGEVLGRDRAACRGAAAERGIVERVTLVRRRPLNGRMMLMFTWADLTCSRGDFGVRKGFALLRKLPQPSLKQLLPCGESIDLTARSSAGTCGE